MTMVRYQRNHFEVHDPDEADKLGIEYIHNWRDATDGDWILTDDRRVLQVISRKEYHSNNRKKATVTIRTGYGKTPTYHKHIFARPCRNYSRDEDFVYNVKATTKQREVVEFLLDKGVINEYGRFKRESLIQAWMSAYRENNPNTALFRANKLMKKPWVRNVMSQRMQSEFEKLDINDEWLAEQYKEMFEKNKGNLKFRVLDAIADMIDAKKRDDDSGSGEGDMFLPPEVIHELEVARKFLALFRSRISDIGEGKMIIDAEFRDTIVSLLNQSGIDNVKKEFRTLPDEVPGENNESEEQDE